MQYANLGRNGLQVSRLCLGMMSYGDPAWQPWVLPSARAQHFVARALEAGINFFDTADFYSYGASEEALGSALASLGARSRSVVCTKVGLPMRAGVNGGGLSRKHVRESVHASLKRLQTDYIDIYLLHQPDPLTPIDETLDAMADLVREGKVLYTGASNYPAWMLAKGVYGSPRVPTTGRPASISVAQVQYNLCYREDERDVLPMCEDMGVGVMVYSPLARGWLAGNRVGDGGASGNASKNDAQRASSDAKAHSLYGNDGDRAVLSKVIEVATRKEIPPARLAMAWVLANPVVSTMLCGVLDDRHLEEAILALDVRLDADDLLALESAYRPQAPKDTGLKAVLSSGGGNRKP